MKTIFIYDTCGESPLQFFVKEGDFSDLDGCYLNLVGNDPVVEDRLTKLLDTVEVLSTFPVEEALTAPVKVVVVGFVA